MAQVLLATGNGTAGNAGDAALSSRLSATLGHTVTLCATNAILANVAGKDLVVVTASGNSSAVSNLSGLSIPVWIAESYNWDNQGWANSPSNLNAGLYLRITRNHHPITQTLPLGLHRLYTSQPSTSYLLGDIAGSDAACLAVPSNPTYYDRPYLATYDVGDKLTGGGTAAYRICLFGVWDSGPSFFTDFGWTLFDRSIGWLLGTLPDCAALQSVGTGSASASAGPYSAANHWTGSDAPDLNGRTFFCAFELDDTGVRQDLWAHSSGSSGWVIGTETDIESYGPTYSEVRITLPGGSGDVLFGQQRLQKGRNVIAVSLTGGTARVSVNGRAPDSSGVTYAAPSGATHYAGRSHSTDYGTGLRLIAAAMLDTAITDSDQLAHLTDRSAHGFDHGLAADVTSHASLRWHLDFGTWDGVSSTLADDGGGAGACTLTEVGTVPQTTLAALTSYAYGPESLHDTIAPAFQRSHYHHDSWARVRLTTDSPAVRWSGGLFNPGSYLPVFEASIDVGGTYTGTTYGLSPHVTADLCELAFSGLGGASKTVDLYPGVHGDFSTTDHGGLYHCGQIRVESGSAVAIVAPSAPVDRLVMIGDSIMAGVDARPAGAHSFATGVRRGLAGDGWQTTVDAWRSRALGDVAIAALVADTIARCDGTAQNVVLMQLGTNDYGDNRTAAAFQTDLETFCDDINTADPAVEIYVLTALDRGDESANGAGSTLPDFRAAASTVAGARAWVTIIDGPAAMDVANLSDGLHPDNVGMGEVEAAILAALPPAAGAGAIAANDLTAGAPALDAPAVTQTHGLAAAEVTTGAPTLASPAVSQVHALAPSELTASGPVLGSPAAIQAHTLSAVAIDGSAPALGSPALSQAHGLTSTEITAGAPVLDSPTLTEIPGGSLAATPITTGAPVLDSPGVTQAHTLTASDVSTGAPLLGAPSLSGDAALAANGITTGAPTLEAPALSQVHVLSGSDVATGAPLFGSPTLSIFGAIGANGITAAPPLLDSPELSQLHQIAASSLTLPPWIIDSPTINDAATRRVVRLAWEHAPGLSLSVDWSPDQ